MIEENILEWIELGDSIQKMELYKKNNKIFKLFCSLSQHSHFSIYFYYIILVLFFGQIWSLNLYLLKDIKGDFLLEVINYFHNIFLLEDLITNKNIIFISLLVIIVTIFLLSFSLLIINTFLINKKKKIDLLLNLNAILNILNIYYLNGPNLEIIFTNIRCYKDNDNEFEICSFKKTTNLIILIICIIYGIIILVNLIFLSLYINDIGCINGTNVKCKISSNFTLIMLLVKLIYFIFHFVIQTFIGENNKTLNNLYYICFIIFNIALTIYSDHSLFYYNHSLNILAHNGWYFSAWFSVCILFKYLLNIKIISLAIIFGLIIISIGIYFYRFYSIFNLIRNH